jgi:hypothetical protein
MSCAAPTDRNDVQLILTVKNAPILGRVAASAPYHHHDKLNPLPQTPFEGGVLGSGGLFGGIACWLLGRDRQPRREAGARVLPPVQKSVRRAPLVGKVLPEAWALRHAFADVLQE